MAPDGFVHRLGRAILSAYQFVYAYMIKIIAGLFAAVAVGTGGWFMMHHPSTPKADRTNTEVVATSTTPSTESFSAKSSLKDIVARGGSWQCTYQINVAGVNSTGTVYVAGGKVRSDFSSKVPQVNMTIDSHMVSDGAYAYTWTSAMPQGYKVALDAKAKTAMGGSAPASAHQDFDYNGALDYNCVAWPTDESKFVVPTNITFTTVKS